MLGKKQVLKRLLEIFSEEQVLEQWFLEFAQGRQPSAGDDVIENAMVLSASSMLKMMNVAGKLDSGWGLTPFGYEVWNDWVYPPSNVEQSDSGAHLSDKRVWMRTPETGTYHLQQHAKREHARILSVTLEPKIIGQSETFDNLYRTSIQNVRGVEVWKDRQFLTYNAAKKRAIDYLNNDEVMSIVIPEYLIPVYIVDTPNGSENCLYTASLDTLKATMTDKDDYIIHMMNPETVQELTGFNKEVVFTGELSYR